MILNHCLLLTHHDKQIEKNCLKTLQTSHLEQSNELTSFSYQINHSLTFQTFGRLILNPTVPKSTTAKKVSEFRVILVRIFSAFSRFQTEYAGISPYSVRMRQNSGKMRTRITPNTDTFLRSDASLLI